MREVGGVLGGTLAGALAEVNPDEFTSLPKWEGALEIAVRVLPLPGQATSLLESWPERAGQNLRFFDVVLYRLIRYLPNDHPVHQNALQYNQVLVLAKRFAKESGQMRRVLRNTCNIEIDSGQKCAPADADKPPH